MTTRKNGENKVEIDFEGLEERLELLGGNPYDKVPRFNDEGYDREMYIEKFMKKLTKLWKKSKGLRFGQLVECVIGCKRECVFGILDKDSLKLIESAIKDGLGKDRENDD